MLFFFQDMFCLFKNHKEVWLRIDQAKPYRHNYIVASLFADQIADRLGIRSIFIYPLIVED